MATLHAISHLTLTGSQAGRTLCGRSKDPDATHYHAVYVPPVILESPAICPDCLCIWKSDVDEYTPGDPLPFAGIHLNVMQGSRCVARACSHTMAKRISRALNKHIPNAKGY